MIYTITFNPALDYMVTVEDFQMGMTNRTVEEYMLPGGKGINVSIVLSNLGFESTALGFTAGFTGEEIRRRLNEMGCKTEFVELPAGMSRINVKLQSVEGTEINSAGPEIDPVSLDKLLQRLDQLDREDILVLAGSIPRSVPDTIYRDIMVRLEGKGIRIVVDATGDLLCKVLQHKPFLIKPNNHELGEIFGIKLQKRADVIPYAKKMQEMGACNVLVSMAGEGAVLAAQDGKIYESPAPKGKLINGVGAGDSMVAGFLAGFLGGEGCKESGNYKKAFQTGVAAGSASAFSKLLATKEEVEKLLSQMEEL
ncbi:MAG: 1-phosphofructokinase [Lachnospiraceae bacterium]|nr:1-phosphofructokinase [Lachnospiraceae bacterium]